MSYTVQKGRQTRQGSGNVRGGMSLKYVQGKCLDPRVAMPTKRRAGGYHVCSLQVARNLLSRNNRRRKAVELSDVKLRS